ncbi:sensor histidine kinase [Actinoplanes sp. G11-F43]|uniref:sensor histidine kinase n=1 Tax=Actinoplanes sp. G11-F43 TaxID=3424130 RepID=UPI003D330344
MLPALWLALAAWRWPVPALVYYPVLLGLVTAAVTITPYAMFGSWIVALHAFVLFPAGWAFVWSVAGALLLTSAQTRGPALPGTETISLLAPLAVAGWFLSRESEERRRALAENLRLRDDLVARAREAGVRDERARVAREIHDAVAQDLSAAVALLEGAVADGVTERRVAQARDLTRSGLAETRRSVLALSPGPLRHTGLAEALDHLVAGWSDRTGVNGSFHSDPEPWAAGPETESALYRIAQSALANVAEHAGAGRVRVTLSYLDDEVVLDVRDDGSGFEPGGPARGRGFGLDGMRRRLRELGGTLDVESEPGGGTALRAAVPAR